MAATVPHRSPEQYMAALRRANEIRGANGRLKRAVKAGDVSAADVLLDPPESALSMPIGALLLCVSHCGEVKMSRLLRPLHISPQRRIGRLTERERRLLAAALGGMIRG